MLRILLSAFIFLLSSCKVDIASEWYESSPDTILDGAVRTSIWTSDEDRYLYIRCFRATVTSQKSSYDIRYEIDVPLLKRVTDALQKATDLSVILGIDGKPAGTFKTRVGFQNDRLWFLFDVDKDTILKLASAKKEINALPRQGEEKLDKIIKFSVSGLMDRIKPVIDACKDAVDPSPPATGNVSKG